MASVGGPLVPQGTAWIVWTHVSYLALSAALILWVARTLFRNGKIFLLDAFLGNERMATSFNRLLVIGVSLVNVGYVTLALKYGAQPATFQDVLEVLSTKIGLALLVIGLTYFTALFSFTSMRKRALLFRQVPSLSPEDQ